MNKNELPTVKEFLIKNDDEDFRLAQSGMYLSEMMVEFAKLHIEQASKAALNNVKYANGNDSAVDDIDEDSILNTYSLDNIK